MSVIPLSRPPIDDEIKQAVLTAIDSRQYILGPQCREFETELARYTGTRHAVLTSSATAALWMTLKALGVKSGDEILVPSHTAFPTVEAICFAEATPVFVDADPHYTLDPEDAAAKVSPRTVGIVPVHLYGLTADMKSIGEIARKRKLWVVEDNAQAIDGHGPGWKQGQFSDAVCTSFIIQKNLGTFGDGGAVVTNRDDVDATVRRLRNHGSTVRSVHSMGYNSRLDDIHAAVLSVKLRHITKWTDRRRAIAARYTKGLQGTSLKLPYEPAGYRHVFHLYVVETPKRDALEKFLLEQGVDAKLHYPIAIHQQEGYPWGQLADLKPDVPNCERNAAQCLSLPMFPELTDDEVDYTIEKCVEWDRKNR